VSEHYIGREVEQKMSIAEGLLWWTVAIPFSLGLAYPAYRARKSKIHRTSKFYTA
jgi:hypothetical protein